MANEEKKKRKSRNRRLRIRIELRESSKEGTCDDDEPLLQQSDDSDFNYDESDPECICVQFNFLKDT